MDEAEFKEAMSVARLKARKAVAVANAVANTMDAMNKAMCVPVVGPALAYSQLRVGMAQVEAIRSSPLEAFAN